MAQECLLTALAILRAGMELDADAWRGANWPSTIAQNEVAAHLVTDIRSLSKGLGKGERGWCPFHAVT